jgi:hypothetical protein
MRDIDDGTTLPQVWSVQDFCGVEDRPTGDVEPTDLLQHFIRGLGAGISVNALIDLSPARLSSLRAPEASIADQIFASVDTCARIAGIRPRPVVGLTGVGCEAIGAIGSQAIMSIPSLRLPGRRHALVPDFLSPLAGDQYEPVALMVVFCRRQAEEFRPRIDNHAPHLILGA